MTNSNRENGDGTNRKDRLLAGLALAASRPAASADDVGTDKLLALRAGTLPSDARQQVLAAIDRSYRLYEEWLILNSSIDQERSAAAPAERQARGKIVAWGNVAVAIAATALMLTFLRDPVPDTGELIDAAYALARDQGLDAKPRNVAELPPNTSVAYGLAGTASEAAGRALRAGLWVGAATLRGEMNARYPLELLPPSQPSAEPDAEPWRGTRWRAWQDLRRWLALVYAVCQREAAAQVSAWAHSGARPPG